LSPCHRRLRALERSAAISAYLNAAAFGFNFEALVSVTMRDAARDTLAAFEQAVAEVPQILQAQRLFGDPDYLLRIVTRDLPAFQKFYDDRLATLPGVQRLSSTLVMKSIVENRPLPLGRAPSESQPCRLVCATRPGIRWPEPRKHES
jgi:DNA-binding Lrp family transcriptional regulator